MAKMLPKDLETAVNSQRYIFHGDTIEYLDRKLEHPPGFYGSIVEGYPVTSFSLDPEKAIQHALNRAKENDATPVLIAINGILYLERMSVGKELGEIEVEGIIPKENVIVVDSIERLRLLYSLRLDKLLSQGDRGGLKLLEILCKRLFEERVPGIPLTYQAGRNLQTQLYH